MARRWRLVQPLMIAAIAGQLACGEGSPGAPSSGTQVEVSGTVRDALNGDLLSFGMIQRYQPGNSAGDTIYQAPGGYCPYCAWSNGPPGNGRFTFSVIAGVPFTLSVFVTGFEDQIRHLTITEPTTVDLAPVPKPVKIQLEIVDDSSFGALQCFPAQVEFIGGPNAGRMATLVGGTQFIVEDLQPTDSLVRVSAPGYQLLEQAIRIRPEPDYPEVAGGWVLPLSPASQSPVCAA